MEVLPVGSGGLCTHAGTLPSRDSPGAPSGPSPVSTDVLPEFRVFQWALPDTERVFPCSQVAPPTTTVEGQCREVL